MVWVVHGVARTSQRDVGYGKSRMLGARADDHARHSAPKTTFLVCERDGRLVDVGRPAPCDQLFA
jgi:hypothetical protein